MFDRLRESLKGFQSDVEAEADVEEGEGDDGAAHAGESTDPEVDASTDADGHPAAGDGEPAAGDGHPAAGDGDLADDGGAEAETGSVGDTSAGDSSAGDASAGGSSAGFAKKASSFARGRIVIEEQDLEDPLWELEMALLDADVEMSVAEAILDGVRERLVGETRGFTSSTGSIVEDALREALLEVIAVGQFDFDERVAAAEKPLVVIFTGVNGVGKTTTIAKLSEYLAERGCSSVLANGDTYRAGANEQIKEHANRLDRQLISHQQGGDPAAVIYDAVEYAEANGVDVVLGDTAGRLHTSEGLMDQLAKIDRVVEPDMTLFVDEAVAGQDAVRRAEEFDDAASIDGAILTKADADAKGGAAISIAHVTGKPILFLGTGQEYGDIERFDPEELVDRLLTDA